MTVIDALIKYRTVVILLLLIATFTILKSVFRPAKFKGENVRQLVQQKISFKAPGT